MASDQQVSARAVLDAMMEVQRRGHRVLEDLEQIEPDLASYLMESPSTVHGKLIDLGGTARQRTHVPSATYYGWSPREATRKSRYSAPNQWDLMRLSILHVGQI